MIYLLGINHRLQWDRNHSNTNLLIQYAEKKIKKHKIEILAEEFSKDIFKDRFYMEQNINTTPLYDIALKLTLRHIYCDPDINKRAELGIRRTYFIKKAAKIDFLKPEKDYSPEEYKRFRKERKKDDDIREMYWVDKILNYRDKNLLFICGIQHLNTFKEKLISKEFKVLTFRKIFDDEIEKIS